MRKLSVLSILCGALTASGGFAGSARADDAVKEPAKAAVAAPAQTDTAKAAETQLPASADAKKAPETVLFDKAKLGTVKFPHKTHMGKVGSCDACHGGDKPLFPQKKTDLKMKDMYAGGACGACHDGKEHYGVKAVFKAQGACMKCHKKDEKKEAK